MRGRDSGLAVSRLVGIGEVPQLTKWRFLPASQSHRWSTAITAFVLSLRKLTLLDAAGPE
jgi:hypothetical protein